ncbi:Atypical dual-specificity phosphatase Siw14-like [Trypanosoma melophagium]|uniref:Atypical dual-specificity phosphatase Siw14-like n=1 Tax=Trypanosoma melophagium TaxID=715481 RepID=UPI00351A04EA|nr:Atypical dual-specificity phosphatase Siw14-like [Trypanosoma melophagium]
MYQRAVHQTWTPPPNFAMVETGVYRSAYPTLVSVPYLKHIGIKTVVLLSIELLPAAVTRALASTDAVPIADGLRGKKDEGHTVAPIRVVCTADLTGWMNEYSWAKDDFCVSDVQHALDFALQRDFQPVLFTCPTGELQTSVVVGCMRRYQGWTIAAALAECEMFVNISRSVRPSIMSFIEHWDLNEQPVMESDIARRKHELLMRERQHDHHHHHHHRRKGYSSYNAVTDSDSENEDIISHGTNLGSSSSRGDKPLSISSKGCKSDGVSTLSHVAVLFASWYTKALERCEARAKAIIAARSKRRKPQDPLPIPHERYFGVLNPPSLDERSTFTKESVVEEDDD